jgi:DNA-directed RNA polymerase specialized sigma24 family protein
LRDQRIFAHDVRTDLVELVVDDQCSAEHLIEVRRRAEWLRRALAELPTSHAETIILHDVLGHSLPEVARLTGVTVAAAQSRLCRGRRRLLRIFARMERFARAGWVEGSG